MRGSRLKTGLVVAGAALAVGAAGRPAAAVQGKPACTVGMPVKVLSCINYPGKIIAHDAKSGRWQVQCDSSGYKEWIAPRMLSANCTAAEPAAVEPSWFIGGWTMFIGPTPQYERRGSDRHLVVGPGAQGGLLTVSPDGTYAWGGARGRWRAMTSAELKYGTTGPALLLLNGPSGMDWQLWRREGFNRENRDGVRVEGMKIGLAYDGTRR